MASGYPVGLAVPVAAPEGEPELVARAARGDHEAFATLVRPYERVAYRVAAAITGWNADAEEATQNGFVKAYRSLHRFRAGAAFRPWLLRIVVNEAHNVLRSERRHARLGERAAERHDAAIGGADETVIAREEVETVLCALGKLPDADRLALALRYFAELPDARGRRPAGRVGGCVSRPPPARTPAARSPAGGSRWLSTSSSCACRRSPERLTRTRRPSTPPCSALLLGGVSGQRVVALAAVVAVAGVVAAPAAVSALRGLFTVEKVAELGPAPGVTAPFEGRAVPPDAVQWVAPFRVRTISSLGAPDAAYVRDDITGGMVTVVYGRTLLTQWRTTDVDARIEIVPSGGAASDVTVGGRLPALWIEGTARGTFTLIGADGTVHRERFEVSPGVLLWKDQGRAFLLQGAGSKDDAVRLAGAVD